MSCDAAPNVTDLAPDGRRRSHEIDYHRAMGWRLVLPAVAALAGCRSQAKVDPQLEADALLFCRAWEANGRPDSVSMIAGYLAWG